MSKYLSHIVFLLICVLSRLVSAIYYIEDPDSLRFALSVFHDFDLMALQPHFPGYPVFVFLVKAIYFIFGNFAIAFSVIGGISVYFIIIYVLKLLDLPLLSLEGGLTAIFIFFNPMIWLMSNKYMPDLAGVAVMIAAFYYLVTDTYNKSDAIKGWLLVGILAGVRLSYMPFLIIPCIYAFFTKKKYLQSIFFLILGILFWLVPVILDTGWENLLQVARLQSEGHFYDFGGTIITESDNVARIVRFIQSIWADALGGYWIDRNPALLINSAGILVCSFFGFLILMSFGYSRSKIVVVVGSCLLYMVWAYFFQNIIYTSRHILPLVPFILILISYGVIYFLVNYNFMYVKALMLVFVLSNIFLTIALAVQHTYPSAIAQVKGYIIEKKEADEKIHIVSIPLINEYLSAQKVKANYISVHQDSVSAYKEKINSIRSGKIILIGNFSGIVDKKPINIFHFKHNPYVNRIWADIYVYEYYLK